MFLVLKIRTRTVFVHIWGFQTQCPYRYYTLTISVCIPIVNNTRTVSKKTTIWVLGPIPVCQCLYTYGDFVHMGATIYVVIVANMGPSITMIQN